ncbi:hypothetical protein P3T23_002018 [Paraburkholderia sp. GAS448]|uniref:hypothetical protein n=1 Tax=Paraburkholderia sp. GAS448 TaxID=3035136 RepID=UPI003D209E7F
MDFDTTESRQRFTMSSGDSPIAWSRTLTGMRNFTCVFAWIKHPAADEPQNAALEPGYG